MAPPWMASPSSSSSTGCPSARAARTRLRDPHEPGRGRPVGEVVVRGERAVQVGGVEHGEARGLARASGASMGCSEAPMTASRYRKMGGRMALMLAAGARFGNGRRAVALAPARPRSGCRTDAPSSPGARADPERGPETGLPRPAGRAYSDAVLRKRAFHPAPCLTGGTGSVRPGGGHGTLPTG